MKIVFFGGSGFLGSHVCDKLSDAGHDVTIVDLRPSPYLRPDQKMVTGSLLDEDLVNTVVSGADAVCICCAMLRTRRTNCARSASI